MIEIKTDMSQVLVVNGTYKVSATKTIVITGTNTQLDVVQVADFSAIPKEYHEIYMNALISSFENTTISDNTPNKVPQSKWTWYKFFKNIINNK